MGERLPGAAVMLFVTLGWFATGWSADDSAVGYGIGRPATEEDIRTREIDIATDGAGLPPGQGTAT